MIEFAPLEPRKKNIRFASVRRGEILPLVTGIITNWTPICFFMAQDMTGFFCGSQAQTQVDPIGTKNSCFEAKQLNHQLNVSSNATRRAMACE